MSEFTHAGGIVFRHDSEVPRYLIITGKSNPEHWVFPKGHINPGEMPEQTAEREVLEETGIEAKTLEFVSTTQFETQDKVLNIKFYLMEFITYKGKGEDREKRWCTYEEGLKLLSFEDSRELLRISQPIVEKFIES